jgi:hypothetical protein
MLQPFVGRPGLAELPRQFRDAGRKAAEGEVLQNESAMPWCRAVEDRQGSCEEALSLLDADPSHPLAPDQACRGNETWLGRIVSVTWDTRQRGAYTRWNDTGRVPPQKGSHRFL